MYERLEECPACKFTNFANYKICQDHTVSQESFALVACQNCGLVFTNPRPNPAAISKYYESQNYISHTNKSNNIINLAYKIVRQYTLSQKLDLIKQYSRKQRILDYGCGTGAFLHHCSKKEYQIAGYEPNPTANKQAHALLKTPILSNSKQFSTPDEYDIITAWHVIEHVHELTQTLKFLRSQLQPKGYMFIALPNLNSYDARKYSEHWAAFDVPRHLYHFSRKSFTSLARKLKMQVVAIHPMKFDAYYVSILSEKYISGKNNFLKALKTGYKSNQEAKKSKEYSSLIYVLKK